MDSTPFTLRLNCFSNAFKLYKKIITPYKENKLSIVQRQNIQQKVILINFEIVGLPQDQQWG